MFNETPSYSLPEENESVVKPDVDQEQKVEMGARVFFSRKTDLHGVKREIKELFSHKYPLAHSLIKKDEAKFNKMYTQIWDNSKEKGIDRKWGVVKEIERRLSEAAQEEKQLNGLEEQIDEL